MIKWEGKFWGTKTTKEDCPTVKQKVRRMRLEMSDKIKAEVMKLFDVGFLAVTSYP